MKKTANFIFVFKSANFLTPYYFPNNSLELKGLNCNGGIGGRVPYKCESICRVKKQNRSCQQSPIACQRKKRHFLQMLRKKSFFSLLTNMREKFFHKIFSPFIMEGDQELGPQQRLIVFVGQSQMNSGQSTDVPTWKIKFPTIVRQKFYEFIWCFPVLYRKKIFSQNFLAP